MVCSVSALLYSVPQFANVLQLLKEMIQYTSGSEYNSYTTIIYNVSGVVKVNELR